MFLHIVYIQSRFPFKINFKHTKRNDSVEEISGVFKESKIHAFMDQKVFLNTKESS